MDYLGVVLRLLHILAATTTVGGMLFLRFALLPALSTVEESSRRQIHEAVRKRWFLMVQIAIAGLLLSGLVNFFLFMGTYKTWGEVWYNAFGKTYNMLFGIKFLLAMIVFFISSALVGRAPALQKMRDNARSWLSINLLLVLAIIVLSGMMRQTHLGPTAPTNYESRLVESAK